MGLSRTKIVNNHSYIIISDAFDHHNDYDCPFNNVSIETYSKILASMGESVYYGCEKEATDPHAGDYLFYAIAYEGTEAEIGIKYLTPTNVYDDNGEPCYYERALIYHAMIPRTIEFEHSIVRHIKNGAREWWKE